MSSKLELIIDAGAMLGEGPCWDKRQGLLYWVDIIGECIHVYNPHDGSDRAIPVGMMPGAVVLRESGGLVMAAGRGLYGLDAERGEPKEIAILQDEPAGNRFNDGKCDPAGRFWAGTMPMGESAPTGSLYCLDTEHSVARHAEAIYCSNGLAWSADHATMYYIDSPTKKVVAYEYDKQAGTIANPRTVVVIPEGEGVPDGMTIDDEGMLWIAQWDGWKVSRWNPADGTKIGEIAVPASQVTSCTFGGDRMDELYITTARVGLDEAALVEQPHAGGLFRIKLGVIGTESYLYKG
ncbi:SMP-30/gluconolactonase/LRE family protein [Paenibacillus chungangensis]|uniref:Regucalcin n=1 Tax=Paenibacillus chungangensis TaxID=696535 RepID=A0ABW3HTH0_9BACL